MKKLGFLIFITLGITFNAKAQFQLELFHLADQEANSSAIVNAPNLSAILNALKAQDLGNDSIDDNTLIT